MKTILMIAVLLAWCGRVFAADIQVGIFGDDDREVTCVTGPPGSGFQLVAWVQIPNDLGLAYVTFRFRLPANVDFTNRPLFHPQVYQVIFTDYVDGTSEWNMVFAGCPSGWVRIFTQQCTLLDDQPSRIGILGAHSMVRDCTFILNDVTILNELEINDPGCATVPAAAATWGSLKGLFR